MRPFKRIKKYENLKGIDVEKICASRDKKNIEEFTHCQVILNNVGDIDILANKKGIDCVIIDKCGKKHKVDLKPCAKLNYRNRFVFELEVIYDDGSSLPGWALYDNLTKFVAFTDDDQVVFFDKKLVIQQMKVIKEKYSDRIYTKRDTDYNKTPCTKKLVDIGYNCIEEIFNAMQPFGYKRVDNKGKFEIRRFRGYKSFCDAKLVSKNKVVGIIRKYRK